MGYFLLLCIEFDMLLLIKKQIELKVMSFRECHSISSVKLNCYVKLLRAFSQKTKDKVDTINEKSAVDIALIMPSSKSSKFLSPSSL